MTVLATVMSLALVVCSRSDFGEDGCGWDPVMRSFLTPARLKTHASLTLVLHDAASLSRRDQAARLVGITGHVT